MKSLTLLFEQVLIELGAWCHTSTIRDWKTVTARFEHEGLSFLTITLPTYGKDFERSLDRGKVDLSDSFLSFKSRQGLPVLLSGFLGQVFDRTSGQLLEEPSVDAIYAIRQLTLMFGKINIDCTPERESAAIAGFFECEQELQRNKDALSQRLNSGDFQRVSSLLFSDMLRMADKDVLHERILPKHGPGATAEKLKGNRKFVQAEWTTRLEREFKSIDFLMPSPSYWKDLGNVAFLEPDQERPVRVVLVPKTQKTPRIIAIEPTCMQYVQQGILESFENAVVANDTARAFISWESQLPNQEMAYQGSILDSSPEMGLATLDLSEASDRVSYQLVKSLLANTPNLRLGVDACRSRVADVDGKLIKLTKFASMGSALCFPIESMVFMTIIFLGIEKELNCQLTSRRINSFRGQVRVYGDDIIIPIRFVDSVIDSLEAYGLKVNTNKSFWTGKFRESCGKEYYNGEDVSIVRIRSELPASRRNVSEIISTVETRNFFYKRGLWNTCRYLDNIISGVLKHYPYVAETSPVLGRISALGFETERMHPTLHSPQVKGWIVRDVSPESNLSEYGALLKFFLKRGDKPIFSKDHLERYGRAKTVTLSLGRHSAI